MIDMYFITFLEERIIISNCYKKYSVVNILLTWLWSNLNIIIFFCIDRYIIQIFIKPVVKDISFEGHCSLYPDH